jgi:hypothetical protein
MQHSAPKNKLNNMPYDEEKSVDVKSIVNLDRIKCCLLFDLDRGLKLVILMAFIDLLYTLGNLIFGMLFYVVSKSKEITINALNFGWILAGISFITIFPLFYIIRTLNKNMA